MAEKAVEVYTDGACRGNPGPGGWGVLLRWGGHERELKGSEPDTTNNRMELQAAIEALSALRRRCRVELYTDSEYLRRGITEWLPGWKQRGWKTASRKPVRNRELWEALDRLQQKHEVRWHWVKAHAGHPGNERADALANEAIDEMNGRGA